jgi:membrane protease YdiL (CAAX protease family)
LLPARVPRASLRRLARRAVLLTVLAACEEALWRWGALRTLAPAVGAGAALALTSLAFALAHVTQRGLRSVRVHVLTGSVFGGLYLASGSLVAPVAAHAGYNVLVAAALEGRRRAPP